MSTTRTDYSSTAFKSMNGKIEQAFEEVKKLGNEFEDIINALETVWTTDGGKKRIGELRTTKAQDFDSLIAKVTEDKEKLASVGEDLFKIDAV